MSRKQKRTGEAVATPAGVHRGPRSLRGRVLRLRRPSQAVRPGRHARDNDGTPGAARRSARFGLSLVLLVVSMSIGIVALPASTASAAPPGSWSSSPAAYVWPTHWTSGGPNACVPSTGVCGPTTATATIGTGAGAITVTATLHQGSYTVLGVDPHPFMDVASTACTGSDGGLDVLGDGGLSSYLPTGATVPSNPGGAPCGFRWAQGGPNNIGGHCVTSSTLVSAGWGNVDGCGSITLSFSKPIANPIYVRTDIGSTLFAGVGASATTSNDMIMQTPGCGLTTVADDGKTQDNGCATGATTAAMNAMMNQPSPPSGSCTNTNTSNTNHAVSFACMMIGQNTNGLVSSFNLNLTAGCATVTSTFTNPCRTSNPTDTEGFNIGLPLPTVQIAKTSIGGTGQFGYAVTGTNIGGDSITTSTAGTQVTSGTIHTATNIGQQVTINENSMPANFTFTSVNCTDSSSSVDGNPNSIPATVDPTTHLVTIPSQYMVPSASITCAFVNTFTPPLTPNINLAKTAGTVSGPNSSGVFTATYAVTAKNTGNGPGTYGPLVDTPGFDANFTVTGASWTGASTGAAFGTGPFTLAPANTSIAAGATATYQVTVTFKYTGAGTPTACNGSSGKGLYNSVAATGENGPAADNSACLPPPVPANVFLQKNARGTGTALAGSTWQLQADNAGSPGTVLPGAVSPVAGQTGEFKMSNLLPGTYWLTETTAPHGYELLAQPIEFKVAMDGSVTLVGVDPAVTLGTTGGSPLITVADVAAMTLPFLGGSGTTAYTLAGAGLIGLAGCALVLRRRTNVDRAPRGKRARR